MVNAGRTILRSGRSLTFIMLHFGPERYERTWPGRPSGSTAVFAAATASWGARRMTLNIEGGTWTLRQSGRSGHAGPRAARHTQALRARTIKACPAMSGRLARRNDQGLGLSHTEMDSPMRRGRVLGRVGSTAHSRRQGCPYSGMSFQMSTAQRHGPWSPRCHTVTARPRFVTGSPSGPFMVTSLVLSR